jgi:hypothetical protein
MGEYLAYGLFIILMVGGLRYVMSGIGPDVPTGKRSEPEE